MIQLIVFLLFFYLVGVFFGTGFMFFGFHGRKNMRLFKLTGQNNLVISASLAYAVSIFFATSSLVSFILAAETCRLVLTIFLPI
jgi:hypothetical protein